MTLAGFLLGALTGGTGVAGVLLRTDLYARLMRRLDPPPLDDQLAALRVEVHELRLELAAEKARDDVLLNHLRETVGPMEDLRQIVLRVANGVDVGDDRRRMGKIAGNLRSLDALTRALAIVSVEAPRP